MSLARFDRRRYRRPDRPDDARRKLEEVVLAREFTRPDGTVVVGPPIDRSRGHRPTDRWSRRAGRYIGEEHYAYCVEYAGSRGARHIPIEDMVQVCMVGCFTALERFDLDHAEAYRFLSYAKWWMYFETNRLLHRDECLVVVDDRVREARAALARTCPDDVGDEEAAELLKMSPADVRAARAAHLGHEHRAVDERSRAVRRGLGDLRAARDERVAALQQHAGLAHALASLTPLQRQVLWREYGVGEDAGVPEPRTLDAQRAVRRMALRHLREALGESGGEE